MRVYLIGISGTGMASLASLFRAAGHQVQGSDVAFDAPTGPALRAQGISCLQGYDAAHLTPTPDLVIVGNAIRRENVEAVAAERQNLPRSSMSAALKQHFLARRKPLIVTGTHGKTTTSSMAAVILEQAGLSPGWFIGGQPKGLSGGSAVGQTRRKLPISTGSDHARTDLLAGHDGAGPSPFVVEGDEYDAVYWHKKPKFLDYVAIGDDDVVILTSIEHDHIDIYPTTESYELAFRELLRAMPPGGLLVADARDARVRALVKEEARCPVTYYALEGDDTGDVVPTWLAAPSTLVAEGEGQSYFDLYVGGMACGRFALQAPGRHNVRNALAAMAACAEGFGVPVSSSRKPLASFEGVQRRQELLGSPGGIHVYDDFAHHPTAVRETLDALRSKHPNGNLIAVFEPRSATACRSLHQDAYAHAFGAADRIVIAPLGRSHVPAGEQLNVQSLAASLGAHAQVLPNVDAIVDELAAVAKMGDTIAVLSNGTFGGLLAKLLLRLAEPTAVRGIAKNDG